MLIMMAVSGRKYGWLFVVLQRIGSSMVSKRVAELREGHRALFIDIKVVSRIIMNSR